MDFSVPPVFEDGIGKREQVTESNKPALDRRDSKFPEAVSILKSDRQLERPKSSKMPFIAKTQSEPLHRGKVDFGKRMDRKLDSRLYNPNPSPEKEFISTPASLKDIDAAMESIKMIKLSRQASIDSSKDDKKERIDTRRRPRESVGDASNNWRSRSEPNFVAKPPLVRRDSTCSISSSYSVILPRSIDTSRKLNFFASEESNEPKPKKVNFFAQDEETEEQEPEVAPEVVPEQLSEQVPESVQNMTSNIAPWHIQPQYWQSPQMIQNWIPHIDPRYQVNPQYPYYGYTDPNLYVNNNHSLPHSEVEEFIDVPQEVVSVQVKKGFLDLILDVCVGVDYNTTRVLASGVRIKLNQATVKNRA